ncbi:hypothetical protein PR202_ga22132 [Eleusine coracana subsp. coracana]|uniref:GTD-binding domain-containing protein n=1 Tax=Eleusine coracana subsp. coracana TaxID=191504 RepID=A0AAV5D2A8_ELECO|nr:hypothetical protein PR202_ga22132 [Eleusine coracana subsp. coracana]
MAAEGPSDDPCPLCGGVGAPAARVTLAKRRLFPADSMTTASARVGAGEEASALRESLASQRRAVAGLQAELEAEQAAAADAASEAMSMILRLQRDKSEAMMEARQYRRFAEERFAHDAAEADALRGALARRDAAIHALSARLRECQDRLLRLGYPSPAPASLPSSPVPVPGGRLSLQDHRHRASASDDDENYPSIPCLIDHPAPADVGTPRTHHLLNRIPGQDEPYDNPPICGSPCHARAFSNDGYSYDDCDADEYHHLYAMTDRDAPDQDYEEVDRVYTVDAVHGVPSEAGPWVDEEESAEIQKLKTRLQALEADRESMRQAIMSMGDEKAQVVLLREIAQQLCRDGAMFPAVPMKVQQRPLQPVVVAQRKLARRRPSFVKVFIVTVIKL